MLPKSVRNYCTNVLVHRQMFQQIVTNKKLGMTYKKLTSILSEYMTPENLAKVDDYLNITSGPNNFRRRICYCHFRQLHVLVEVIEYNQRLKFKGLQRYALGLLLR